MSPLPLFYDVCPVPVLLLDADDRVVYLNRIGRERLGYELAGVVGRPVSALRSMPFSRHGDFDVVRLRTSSGGELTHLARRQPFPDNELNLAHAEFFRAATEDPQPKVDVRLIDLAHTLTGVGSWDWNTTRGGVTWSPGTFSMYGRDPAEGVPGDEYMQDIHPEDQVSLAQAISNCVEDGAPYLVEYRLRRSDTHEERVIRAVAERVVDENGDVHMAGVAVDVTEAKRAEEQRAALEQRLQQEQRVDSLSVLAGGVAHDFNNLLTTVMGGADLAQMCLEELPENVAPQLDSILGSIGQAAQQAAELCSQLLAYTGRRPLVRSHVAPNALIEGISRLLTASLESVGIALVLDLDADAPATTADPTQLQQVLVNLVINAHEALRDPAGHRIVIRTSRRPRFEPQGGHLVVRPARLDHPQLVLEVEDDGDGISPQLVGRVCEPFFSTKADGRGLGLAASAGIVRAHAGGLEIESQVGAGTVFRIWLSASAEAPKPRSAEPRQPVVWSDKRALVVDDDPLVRVTLVTQLQALGIQATGLGSGEALLERLNEAPPPDVVVLDVVMPGLSGHEVLQRLREDHAQLPVLLVSGYDPADRRLALLGPSGFLAKPFRRQELSQALLELLPDGRST